VLRPAVLLSFNYPTLSLNVHAQVKVGTQLPFRMYNFPMRRERPA